MAAANATIAALKVSLGLDSAQFETGLRDASATMQREARKQAAAADDLARRVTALKSSLDPVYAAQKRVGDQMKEAQALYKAGALSGAEYGKNMAILTARLKEVSTAQTVVSATQLNVVKSSKAVQQAGLGLSRQFADVGVSLAGGISPMMVLIQQGPQIADAFAMAKTQGAGFGTVVKDLAGTVGKFLAAWAPVIGIGAAAAGVFLLWQKHLKDTKAALEATAAATKNLATVQDATRDALASAADFAERYGVANAGLVKSLDAVLISQNAAYKETLAGIDANDSAARTAARRAEIERLLTVSILKRAAAEATARASEATAAAKKAKGPSRTAGIIVGIGLAGDPLALQAAQEAEAAKFKKLGGDAAEKAAAQEREYAKTLNASADALLKAKLIAPEAAAAVRSYGSAASKARSSTKEQTDATLELERALKALLTSLETGSERQLREYNEKTLLLRQGLDAGKISTEEYRDAIDRLNPVVEAAGDAQKAWNAQLTNTPADIKPVEARIETLRDRVRSLAEAFDDVAFSFGSMISSFKTGNFGNLIGDLLTLKDGLASLLSAGAGGVASAGSAIALAIGGKGGRAIGGGLGLAAAGLGAGAFAGTVAGGAALTAAGLGGLVGPLISLAGPLGIAAGALYAASKLFNVGGKPSNAGAGVSLVNGQITGDKRTAETERAATAAADAIKGIQDALKAAGIGLTDAVTGLVIGSRDQTQIYLQSGKTLRSAVGDSGAAVDAALKALLESATYASDVQKKLVEGALAAGKGFDAIADLLSRYEAAQSIGKSLADQILQLTDPKAFDIEGVKRDIAAQREAYKGLLGEGLITTEMLAGFNAQLSTLEALKLDEVLKRYADALPAVNDNSAETLRSAADAATGILLDAYDTFAQAKQAEIDALRQTASGLRDFQRELRFGDLAGRGPTSQLAVLRQEFNRLSGLGAADPERLTNLQGVSQAFIEASRAASPSEIAFARDQAAVRRAVEASAIAATSQADAAQAQLDAQTAVVTQLGILNTTTTDMATALKNYLAAQANAKAGGAATNDNLDVNRYLAVNPDLARNWNAGGSLRSMGPTLEEAARAHWSMAGQYEAAAGLRGFATGGQFKVGGSGGVDSQLMQFWASPGEMVNVSHGDPQSGLQGEIQGLRGDVGILTAAVARGQGFTRRVENFMKKWDGDGLPAERVV